MFKKILLVVVALFVIALVVGLILPAKVLVSRSVLIGRPASLIYATVNSFQLFPKWSPWQELDPNLRQSTEGPREGVGAKLVWSGNSKVGRGTQVITGGVPNEVVESTIEFAGAGGGLSRMTMQREGDATRVDWTMTMNMGANPISHYIGVFMDRMIGPDFATGLSKLKKLVESMPDTDIAGLAAEPVDLHSEPVLLVSETSAHDAIAKAYAEGYGQIGRFIAKNKLRQSGAPLGIEGAMTADSYSFDAGIPVEHSDVGSAEGVRVDKTYAGKALKAVHVGPYARLQDTHDQLLAYAAAHGYVRSGAVFWSFIDDPGKVAEDKLRTEFYAPVE